MKYSKEVAEGSAQSLSKLKGSVHVVFVSLYATCNIGVAGDNMDKFADLSSVLKRLGLPFIIAADWNMSASTLLKHGPFSRLDVKPLLPEGPRPHAGTAG